MKRSLLLVTGLAVLLSTTCKKDYYDGMEVVRLNATLNNPREVIRLGDTLKVTLLLPPTLTSEMGLVTPVNSVQQTLYNFVWYRADTVTKVVTRLVDPTAIVVSAGSLSPHSMSSVYTTTTTPFRSVLNLIPPTKGLYYVQTIKGALKVNDQYQAFLKVNFEVLDKHWPIANSFFPGYDTSPEILSQEADGNAIYWFRVQ